MKQGQLSFTQKDLERLRTIAELYALAKDMVLHGEQIDPEQRTQVQALSEFRHAFDHLMRVFAFKFGIKTVADEDKAEYVGTNIDKAFGHVYRAAYDALDWISIVVMERVQVELAGLSAETIDRVLPTYYPQIRPRINQIITEEIPKMRAGKDVGSPSVENLQNYAALATELKGYVDQLVDAKPGFVDYQRRTAKSKRIEWLWYLLAAIVGGAVVVVARALVGS